MEPKTNEIFGLMAEFKTPEALLHAAEHVRDAGYKNADAYAPFPVHGLTEAMGFPKTRVPLIVLCGGIIGGLTGFFMQYYAQVFSYPLIIAGRPLFTWPSYIPISYECTILFAAFFRRARHARIERPAAAVSSGFQRPQLSGSKPRSIFCGDRTCRRQVQH